MGHYTNYAYVEGRLGEEFLLDILEDQIPDGTADGAELTVIEAYVEAECVKIDALIDGACVKQIAVPVESTNKSFGLLKGVAEALILRKVASHTQHDDVPSKIENEYVSAMRTLGQIMRGELTIAQDGQTGPSTDGDTMAVSESEESPFHTDMEEAW